MSDAKEKLKERLLDRHWRLNNLYFILDPAGKKIPFRMNWAQEDFYANRHYFNVILKARQLGFTTFILIYMLDAALFNDNHECGVIAHDLDSSRDLFDNKVKFACDNLPEWLKSHRESVVDSARKLEFSNGSSFTVGTSLRGGTYQKLLVSEYGKISARFPEKAREIKTGAFNTVHAGQQLFVESTAEGRQGEFFELVQLARKLQDEGAELGALDPKFHFYPWFENEMYALPEQEARNVYFSREQLEYFQTLPVELTLGQKAWYAKKQAVMGDDMKREYPATPDESFEASMEGIIYDKQIRYIRQNKQLTSVPWERTAPVFTFWDLGINDVIWFFQHVGKEYRFIRFHSTGDADLEKCARDLKEFGYIYGGHFLPHDGNRKQKGLKNRSYKEMLEGLGIKPVHIVTRTTDVWNDIRTKCKPVLPRCWFDAALCADGFNSLASYRKVWDERNGVWKDEPRHDEHSHAADAFRTFAAGYEGRYDELLDEEDYEDHGGGLDGGRSSITGY